MLQAISKGRDDKRLKDVLVIALLLRKHMQTKTY